MYRGRNSVALTKSKPPQFSTNGEMKCQCTTKPFAAKRFVSGPHTRNAGRPFWTCPKGRDDPNSCKFFKWEDEAPELASHQMGQDSNPNPPSSPIQTISSNGKATTSITRNGFSSPGQTLGGGGGGVSINRPISSLNPPTPTRSTPGRGGILVPGSQDSITEDEEEEVEEYQKTPPASRKLLFPNQKRARIVESEEDGDDIQEYDGGMEWENLDMDEIEAEAHATSQSQSQSNSTQNTPSGGEKRKRVDDGEGESSMSTEGIDVPVNKTPKKSQWESIRDDEDNPFHTRHQALITPTKTPTTTTTLHTPSTNATAGPSTPSLSSFSKLSEEASSSLSPLVDYVTKLERKLKASEQSREYLKKRVGALEQRVRDLEQ